MTYHFTKNIKSFFSIVACAKLFTDSSNKNVHLAVATVMLNVSAFFHERPQEFDNKLLDQMMPLFDKICVSGIYEKEAMVRSLIALGTISSNDEIKGTVLSMVPMLQQIASQHGDIVASIIKEIQSVLNH